MQADFVLGKWLPEEKPLVLKKIHICIEIIESYATIGLERTMNVINNKSIE